MRHTIETAPKDRKPVILEDDATGTYDVAHWSPEAGTWIGKNSEPTQLTPTHWHPLARDAYVLQEDEVSSNRSSPRGSVRRHRKELYIGVTVAAGFLAFYAIREAAPYDSVKIIGQAVSQATQFLSRSSKIFVSASQQTDTKQTNPPSAPQAQAASVLQARQPRKDERIEALAQELAEARQTIGRLDLQLREETAKGGRSLEQERKQSAALALETAAARNELAASSVRYRQALDEEGARSTAMQSELATAKSEIEAQAARLRTASDEAGQLAQAEAAKNLQALEQERKKSAALALEGAAAKTELVPSLADFGQALKEENARSAALERQLATAQAKIETEATRLHVTGNEREQPKQVSASTRAKLEQSPQQARDRIAAMARDIAPGNTIAQATPEPAKRSQMPGTARALDVVAVPQTAVADIQSSPEAVRLIARASTLLVQGDIGAARTVLESAAETGSARASFMLAQTYDPAVLAAWGTFGTRGEVVKARELYAKAHAGGIQEAKDRFNALQE